MSTRLHGTTDQYWCGALASSIAHFLTRRIEEEELRGYYSDFLRSPVADAELKALLPKVPAKGKR